MKTDREFLDGIYEKARAKERSSRRPQKTVRYAALYGAAAAVLLLSGAVGSQIMQREPQFWAGMESSFEVRKADESEKGNPQVCSASPDDAAKQYERLELTIIEATGQISRIEEIKNGVRLVILLDEQEEAGDWSGMSVEAVFSKIPADVQEGQRILWRFYPKRMDKGVYQMDEELDSFYLLSGWEDGTEQYCSLTGEKILRQTP